MKYLWQNLLAGLKTSPLKGLNTTIVIFLTYSIAALAIGLGSKLFTFSVFCSKIAFILPFSLFIFPSLIEEALFRGLLIPNNILDKGKTAAVRSIIISTVIFVIWHPLNAYLFAVGYRDVFYDTWFLVIVLILGLTCGVTYAISRSLWVPVIIHWLTVIVWVFLLGGKNIVLDFMQ